LFVETAAELFDELLTDEIDTEPTPPTADAETEPPTLPVEMAAASISTVAVIAPVLVPVKVVVPLTTRDSLGGAEVPDVAKLIESELEAPTAEPEIDPPVLVPMDAETMSPVRPIAAPVLVAVLAIDATVHVPFGAVWATDADAEIKADVTSNANRVFLLIMSITSPGESAS
jgi:fumarate reductase subunit D